MENQSQEIAFQVVCSGGNFQVAEVWAEEQVHTADKRNLSCLR